VSPVFPLIGVLQTKACHGVVRTLFWSVTRGSHCFTCHPHTYHTCLYSPVARHYRPLAATHCAPTKGWPGWVDLGGWLHTEISVPHQELNSDTVTHPNTNKARRRLTLPIDTNAVTTKPDVLNAFLCSHVQKL